MTESTGYGQYREAFTNAAVMLDSSPLFSYFCTKIAEEPCDRDAALFVFFAEHGVRYDMWKGARQVLTAAMSELREHRDHELATYVPVLDGDREPDGHGYDLFRSFLWSRHQAMATKLTRPAVLNDPLGGIRVLSLLADYLSGGGLSGGDGRPRSLDLLNVGAAAGLELVADRLHQHAAGPLDSHDPDHHNLDCHDIVGRRGVDISPIDPTAPDQLEWMLAFLEPEDVAARNRIFEAVRLRDTLGVVVDRGDAFDATAAMTTAPGTLPVIFGVSFLCGVDDPGLMDEVLRGRTGDVVWIADEAVGVLRKLGYGAGLEAEAPTKRGSVLTHYRDGEIIGRQVR